MAVMSFRHSGDLGDCVYSLCAIKALGGGALALVESYGFSREPMTKERFDFIAPLIRAQPYITNLVWSSARDQAIAPISCTLDFDDARRGRKFCDESKHWPPVEIHHKPLLADKWLGFCGVSWKARTSPWLEVSSQPTFKSLAIFNRTQRYVNESFPWKEIQWWCEKQLGFKTAFIGSYDEWRDFCECYGCIDRLCVADALHAAQVIRDAKLFVGSQSCLFAIAEGMKKTPVIQATFVQGADCAFKRPGLHCWFEGDTEAVPSVMKAIGLG